MPFDQDDNYAADDRDTAANTSKRNHEGPSGAGQSSAESSARGADLGSDGPRVPRKRRRYVTRRNALIAAAAIALSVLAFVFLALIVYRLGFVDAYVAGQVKDTLSKYGVRAEIKTFHTSLSPQAVEMRDVELYDSKTGDKLGKIDRLVATVRIEDLYAIKLQRNVNLKDLRIEGLELWVTFDEQGRSNFRNLHIPPPEPNRRILFAYSTAHVEIKNALVHYGDALHTLSGEARNVRAAIEPDNPDAPVESWMNTVSLAASNSTFVYDGRPVNNIDVEARGRVNETRAEVQELMLHSPLLEAHLQGVLDDWRALHYQLKVTSTVDLTQASDVLQTRTALRGVGNFTGTVTGAGERYRVEGSISSDAMAADGVRLQGLNVNAKGSGQGKSYDVNARAVAQLLTAGAFQFDSVQLAGRVMGTGSDFRWLGELRAAAEKSYGTTITGLILRDARAEYRDGILNASAPQITAASVGSSNVRVKEGIQATDLRAKVQPDVTTVTVANVKAGKIEAANATVSGVTASNIDLKSRQGVTSVNVKEARVAGVHALGAQTGSINIAGVSLAVHNGRIEGSTNDINVGVATLERPENGRVEGIKLSRPVFIIEPSGRYRASTDLSIGGGVLGEMKLGPSRAGVVATAEQIQLNNFTAEALEGRAAGNATIARTKAGTSRVSADFNSFDLSGLVTLLSGRVVPVAAKATGKADVVLTGTDLGTATGSVEAEIQGESPAPGSDLTPLSGALALNADHGLFQIQKANLATPASKLNATGSFSLERDSDLHVDLTSSDAGEIQRVFVSSGAIPELEEQFNSYGIGLGGKLAFNGTLQGSLKDPIVNGHAELGSLLVNERDLGSLAANIASTPAELRVTEARLAQPGGGSMQFTLTAPRAGENNVSIDATLDRMNAGNLLAALPMKKQTREQIGDTQSDVSGALKISGLPDAMSGSADLRFGPGRLAGEPLESMTARATFTGSGISLEKVDANFTAGHIIANGKYDTTTKAFDIQAKGEHVQLDRLMNFANRPGLPQLTGTADLTASASGIFTEISSYQVNFNGEGHDVTINGQPAGTLALVGRTENKQLNITFTTGLLGQPQVLTARIDLSSEKLPATIETTITGADLTQIFKLLLPKSDVAVTGRATGVIKASGNLMTENAEGEEVPSLAGLRGTASFSELSVRVEDVQLTAQSPVVVNFSTKEVTFERTQFTGTGTNVSLEGTIATGSGGREALTVDGRVNLRVLNGVSPDVFSSGFADLSVRITGTYEQPRLSGTAAVSGASVSMLLGDERITVGDLKGLVRFNANQAQIDSLAGTLGGGKVRASGGALLQGFSLAQFLLNIHGDNVTINYPQDFRSTVDADLELKGTPRQQLIGGYVRLRHAEYTKPIELAQLLGRRPESSIEEGGELGFGRRAQFSDLRIEGRDALVVRNNLADLIASVSLRIDGPYSDPITSGRITATSGTINFRNNPYDISRGLLEYPTRRGADKIINLQGQSVIAGYRTFVDLVGPLSNPQVTVHSEPALPQADVVSLILTGTLSSGTSTSVLAQSGLGTAASLLTDTLINAPVSRATNKLFGLSRLEINPVIGGRSSSTPTARLTVARRISKEMTITYSTNVASDPNQVLAVEYRVSNRLSFIAQYEQGSFTDLSTHNNNYSFEIRLRKRF
jgi:translocation and assembly module TamB